MSKFVYVTYIRTTPAKLWEALTDPDFNRRYWFGIHCESEWRQGASWQMVASDGTVTDAGEILEAEPEKRLVIKWRNEFRPEMKAEGYTRCSFDIAPDGDTVKLTIIHQIDRDGSKTIEAVSGGWPMILSSLKSLLETGAALEITAGRRESKASDAATRAQRTG
jgi:uncharacterized protein YndB with AHSA1/START domain